MQDHESEQELRDRLNLIERMIAEGRRQTESWGWMFVLWGVVYYVAIAWSAWGHTAWAWPVSMLAAIVVTIVVGSRVERHTETTLGRAVGSIWMALGISLFLLFVALGASGRLTDQHLFVAVISAILGMANGASGLLLRWKAQLACAVGWWAAAVLACFGSTRESEIVFVAAIFFCQIVFGIYAMAADAQWRKHNGEVNARTA